MQKGTYPLYRRHALCYVTPMLDPTLVSRHDAITAQAEWNLPAIEREASTGARVLPPILRGDFLGTYLSRASGRTTLSARRAAFVDAIRPGDFEAVISRRLGFKSRIGTATFIYWRHIPIARLMANGQDPHIFITPYHAFGKAQITRTMFAINPVLEYLMTGVRLDMGGVSLANRHETSPWPKMTGKPAIYIPIWGNSTTRPFWTAKSFEFCKPGPLAFKGGEAWPDHEPLDVASPDQYPIEGLI